MRIVNPSIKFLIIWIFRSLLRSLKKFRQRRSRDESRKVIFSSTESPCIIHPCSPDISSLNTLTRSEDTASFVGPGFDIQDITVLTPGKSCRWRASQFSGETIQIIRCNCEPREREQNSTDVEITVGLTFVYSNCFE